MMVKILSGYNENEQIKSWELSNETLAPGDKGLKKHPNLPQFQFFISFGQKP